MPNHPEVELDTLQNVETGDVLTYNGRAEPVVVKDVKTCVGAETCTAQIAYCIVCDGPRGGDIFLCELECGEFRCARGCDTDSRPLTTVHSQCETELSASSSE